MPVHDPLAMPASIVLGSRSSRTPFLLVLLVVASHTRPSKAWPSIIWPLTTWPRRSLRFCPLPATPSCAGRNRSAAPRGLDATHPRRSEPRMSLASSARVSLQPWPNSIWLTWSARPHTGSGTAKSPPGPITASAAPCWFLPTWSRNLAAWSEFVWVALMAVSSAGINGMF